MRLVILALPLLAVACSSKMANDSRHRPDVGGNGGFIAARDFTATRDGESVRIAGAVDVSDSAHDAALQSFDGDIIRIVITRRDGMGAMMITKKEVTLTLQTPATSISLELPDGTTQTLAVR